ncbi:MAG: DJ-1/PfpI family protein [Candidatus Kariarchaeaceae archaeon]
MTGTLLLVVTNGFNDMAFLSCQVILEERGNDIIVVSENAGTVRGTDTSVMAVSLEDALSQDEAYICIIVTGGSGILQWELLKDTVNSFTQAGKVVGLIGEAKGIITGGELVSSLDPIAVEQNMIILNDIDSSERFAEKLAEMLG